MNATLKDLQEFLTNAKTLYPHQFDGWSDEKVKAYFNGLLDLIEQADDATDVISLLKNSRQ